MSESADVAARAARRCPECGGAVRAEGTEAVCEDCGLIVDEDAIDRGPDWRHYRGDSGPDPRRAYPTDQRKHDDGLGSEQPTGVTESQTATDIAKHVNHHREEVYGLTEVQRLCECLEASEHVADRACALWQQLHEAESLVGKDLDALVAATVWVTGRVCELGLGPADVLEPSKDAEKRVMLRRARWIADVLGLPVPVADYETRVRRLASDVGAPIERSQVEAAAGRVRALDGTTLSGRSPTTVAACALYLESHVDQAAVAEAADIAEASIRAQYDAFEGVSDHRGGWL